MNPRGGTANLGGCCRVVSGSGVYAAFESTASDVVAGPDLNFVDVYVRNLLTGVTTRVSTVAAGNQLTSPDPCASSYGLSLSADGRYVAFSSGLPFVADDTNNAGDAYVKDLVTGVLERVSVTSAGGRVAVGGGEPEVSADGRYVAFMSYSPGLVPGDTNGFGDVYVRDRVASTTTRV